MIIGGTGIGPRLEALGLKPVAIPTAAGWTRGFGGERDGVRLLCVQRHARGHRLPPHAVNYRAMVLGARAAGVRGVLATAAVGCLRPDWSPGTLAICSDFLDLTGRHQTMHDRQVRHVDFTHPLPLGDRLLAAAEAIGEPVQTGAVYAGLNGPRYETPAEIEMVRRLGGDLVGMTASTEAVLFREAGVDYGCLAIVTNLAAGMSSSELSHHEVVDVMEQRGARVVEILLETARRMTE